MNGAIPEPDFQVRQRDLRQAQSQANEAVDRFRKREQARAENLRAELRAKRHEQAHLPERVASGRLSAPEANDRNRALSDRIEALRAELRIVDARSAAETPEELGEFVDLPLDDYPRRIASISGTTEESPAPTAHIYPKRWELISILSGGIVCILAVFLPWVLRGAEAESMFRVGLDLSLDGPNPIARLAWIAYVLAPIAAVVILLRVRGPALGWAVLSMGLLMLAGVLLSVVMAGADRVHAEDFRQLWAALHVGPVLYGAGALVMIVVGALRVSPWSDSLVHSMTVSLTLAAGVAAIAAVVALFLFFGPEPGSVRFELARDDSTTGLVRVLCKNGSRDTLRLAVPWPDDNATVQSGGDAPNLGAEIEVREKGTENYRPLPYSPELWHLPNTPSLELPVVEVRPGSQVELVLDLRQVSVAGADAESIMLTFTWRSGRPVARYEIPLPTRYLSPNAEARNPLNLPQPDSAIPVTESPASAASDDKDVGPEIRLVSLGGFLFTGIIGGKAAVETWDGNGTSTGSRLLQAGDLIGEGWYLESVSESPAAIVVHHDPTGTQIVVSRGNRMSFGTEEVVVATE
ncbi:MAG: hypothetical protein AMXMBFR82_01290 [Candidatus Hydrogenedentota bacterium]